MKGKSKMKKIVTTILTVLLIMCLTACGNTLLKQYENAEDPALLFTDIATEETILSDNDNVIITLNGYPAELTRFNYDEEQKGFWFNLIIENNTNLTTAFVLKFITINGIEMPVDEQDAISLMYPNNVIRENERGTASLFITYEELAQNNIRTIENVSFLVEGYTLNADGTAKDCVYSSGKLEFETIQE